MSRAPVAPLPIDDSTTCDAYDHRTTSGGGASLSPPLSASATEVTDPPRAPEVARLPPGLRGSRYHFYAVRVVGFPEGAAGEPLVAFLRRFGTVPGPGGVQLVTHAWGLEAFLIFQTQEAAAKAVVELQRSDFVELVASGGGVRRAALTTPLQAAIVKYKANSSRATTVSATPVGSAVPGATAWTVAPAPMLSGLTPFVLPFYGPGVVPYGVPCPPLPQSYVLVPNLSFPQL